MISKRVKSPPNAGRVAWLPDSPQSFGHPHNTSSGQRREEGATLIVIVLMALLMLSAFLVISANLSLSARRTTSDQKVILPAQYGAESGVAYAKSLLAASQALMSSTSVPLGTTYGQMKSYIASLCPVPTTVPVPGYNPATAGSTTIPGTATGGSSGIQIPSSTLVCAITTFTPAQANFFAQLVPNTGTAAATYFQYGIPDDAASRQGFFYRAFSSDNYNAIGNAQVKAGLRPVALLQTNKYSYVLYFRVAGVDSTGTSGDSNRRITVKGNDTLHGFTFSFAVYAPPNPPVPPTDPSFASYGAFINKWGDPSGYYANDNFFSGPFHTNSIPSFRGDGSGNSISIDGNLTSAGCPSITTTIDVTNNRTDTCVGTPVNGVINNTDGGTLSYLAGDALGHLGAMGTQTRNDGYGNATYNLYGAANAKGTLAIGVRAGNSNDQPRFNAPFIPMPLNSNKQRDIAQTAGILVANPQKIQLSVSGSGSSAYQVIELVPSAQPGGSPSPLIRFRYASDKVLTIESPANSGVYLRAKKSASDPSGWAAASPTDAPTKFNGMIYADGSISSLSGPTRAATSSSTADGAPAIASFAGITVTAQQNVMLTGDIKYEQRCLSINACTAKTNGEYNIQNVFGLYAGTGDIQLAYNPLTDQQNTTPGSSASAPKNLEIDGFVMAGRGHIIPLNTSNNSNNLDYSSYGDCQTTCDKGNLIVHGGTVKDEDAIVKYGYAGWNENYFYDNRGKDFSPPGFPTTIEGTQGSTGGPGALLDLDNASPVTATSWTSSIGKTNLDGTQSTNSDFSLDNEIRQGTLQ